MEQSAVQHRLKPAPQTLQLKRVSRSELNLDPTVGGLLSGDGQCRLSHVNAQNRQSQRGDVKSILAGPAPHRAPLRRIRLRMPNALLLAAAGQYPKAQGHRGTTHPRAVPSAVRDWLGADH